MLGKGFKMNTTTFIEIINALRRANPNKWYQWQGPVNGKHVQVKGFNTWLQILRSNGVTFPTSADVSVLKFKEYLADCAEYKGV